MRLLSLPPAVLVIAGMIAALPGGDVFAQVVAIYQGTAQRTAGANKPPIVTKAELAFRSLDPGVLDGSATLEILGEKGNFVGRLDGRVLAIVSRTHTHHLAWTGSIDPATGKLVGAVRAIPLDGSAVEVWSYELSPAQAADGIVTELRTVVVERADGATTATLTQLPVASPTPAVATEPPPLVGEWEFFTYIDDLPQTRPLYIQALSGTLFVFRLGTTDAIEETGTYDPANMELRFISGGYTYEGRLIRNRRGEWEIKGPMRRGTGAVADATDSRGSVRAKRVGDLPEQLAAPKTP